MESKFKKGDEVQCISDPVKIGTVVEVCEKHAGVQWYRVNLGGAIGRPKMSEQDLRSYIPNTSPRDNLIAGNIDGYQEFQRLITFQRMQRDHPLRNNIYAFNASRTRFFPYQFKPLLKFLDSPKNRLLIADEVGLGKTIEAGLILTEARARQTIQRVLVVCPSGLTSKWRLELKTRFGEEFRIYKTSDFLEYIDEYEESPFTSHINGIISLETIRQNKILERLEALLPSFDIVIVDEAHHMRNRGRKQWQAGIHLSHGSEAMLMLTATPIHLGNENLATLLNILDEEEFPDFYTTDLRIRDNEPIVKCQICMGQLPPNIEMAKEAITQISELTWTKQNPYFKIVDKRISEFNIRDKNYRKDIIDIQRDLAQLNLIGHIFTRTRKREVHTRSPIRTPHAIELQFTDKEREFYDAVTDFVRIECSQRMSSSFIESFVLQMPQRRMASSIPAMVNHYKQSIDLSVDDLSEDLTLSEYDENGDGLTELIEAKKRLFALVNNWPSPSSDTKYDQLKIALRGHREAQGYLKVMIFSFFKGTLYYLNERLKADGFRCEMIHGDIHPDKKRNEIVEKFRENEDVEILLSSKVGSEGLDFQFCSTLFNYDLPWNPMEIEQRIGRLDRIGQESDRIHIYNFWIKDTIEEKIFRRLYDRINIFRKSIGDLEVILGDVLSSIEKEILSKKLTDEEEGKLLDLKLMALEQRETQLKKLEKEAAQFIGTDQFFNSEVDAIKSRRRYVTGEQLRRFIIDFLRINCPNTIMDYNKNKKEGFIEIDDRLRNVLTKYGQPGMGVIVGNKTPITFDSEKAFENPRIDFINILHPITQAIVKAYQEQDMSSNAHRISLSSQRLSDDDYFYFIYKLRIKGARSRNSIEMVLLTKDLKIACNDEDTEIILGEMVEFGEEIQDLEFEVDAERACSEAERIFQGRIQQIRMNEEQNNIAFIERRLQSLRTSYHNQINNLKKRLERGMELQQSEKIIRMLKSGIRNKETDLSIKENELEGLKQVEVNYDEISAGILRIKNS